MKRAPVQGHPPAYVIASIYARLSQKDEVFTSLEKAFEQRDFRVTKVNVSFEFDSVRSDPRYAEFLKRIECRNEFKSPAKINTRRVISSGP